MPRLTKHLVILAGPALSGKTTVANILVEAFYYQPVRSYTTRPKRANETEDAYHFMSPLDFDRLCEEGKIENPMVFLDNGVPQKYGNPKMSSLPKDVRNVMVLDSREAIRQSFNPNTFLVFLNPPREVIDRRATFRAQGTGLRPDEARIEREVAEFREFRDLARINLEFNQDVDAITIATQIQKAVKEWKEL